MKTRMFLNIAATLAFVVVSAGTSACKDSTAPTPTPTPVAEHGWQVVIEAKSPDFMQFALSSVKSDNFSGLNILNVDRVDGAVVYNLKKQADTVWVGYGIISTHYPSNFDVMKVAWTFSGAISQSQAIRRKSRWDFPSLCTSWIRITWT